MSKIPFRGRQYSSSHSKRVQVTTVAGKILGFNPNRSSFYIVNEDANVAIFLGYGPSFGPHVATAGNHIGERVGPNFGDVYDDDIVDEVWAISTANNNNVFIIETVHTGRMTR